MVKLIRTANVSRPSHKINEPEMLMIIIGGEMAYTRKDGVKVIPIGCLKD